MTQKNLTVPNPESLINDTVRQYWKIGHALLAAMHMNHKGQMKGDVSNAVLPNNSIR
ncbi:UNVERIFIED_ORG: hypothetical protein ABIC54_006616 [Burkholderia sp. 1263]